MSGRAFEYNPFLREPEIEPHIRRVFDDPEDLLGHMALSRHNDSGGQISEVDEGEITDAFLQDSGQEVASKRETTVEAAEPRARTSEERRHELLSYLLRVADQNVLEGPELDRSIPRELGYEPKEGRNDFYALKRKQAINYVRDAETGRVVRVEVKPEGVIAGIENGKLLPVDLALLPEGTVLNIGKNKTSDAKVDARYQHVSFTFYVTDPSTGRRRRSSNEMKKSVFAKLEDLHKALLVVGLGTSFDHATPQAREEWFVAVFNKGLAPERARDRDTVLSLVESFAEQGYLLAKERQKNAFDYTFTDQGAREVLGLNIAAPYN